MKKTILSLCLLTGFIMLGIQNVNAWILVSKSGFGLFGYANPIESRYTYSVSGVTVCAAELRCEGGGFNACKWSAPLTACELAGKVTITKSTPDVFTDLQDNGILFQISELVDQTISNGSQSGTIIYGNTYSIVYNQSSDGRITFKVSDLMNN